MFSLFTDHIHSSHEMSTRFLFALSSVSLSSLIPIHPISNSILFISRFLILPLGLHLFFTQCNDSDHAPPPTSLPSFTFPFLSYPIFCPLSLLFSLYPVLYSFKYLLHLTFLKLDEIPV
ncbi:hypothetical protein C8Q75DRAFT_759140 [Abortiporus biennis]|nr:hypothetical protein C8Q75DRAFT_759140 [Abortiporus biennis]